jgi:microcystin degradation protein MlrC
MRIAVGGLHIECSTYNPVLNSEPDFAILRGEALMGSTNFAFLRDFPARFTPIVHARAIAGGPITSEFYDKIKDELLRGIEAGGPFDGVYLAMHGAAYVEGLEDAEGDLITAVRQRVGPACKIAVSYDLHGNVSQRVVDAIDIFSTYRTAPHIDVEETMRRSVGMLVRALRDGLWPCVVWCPVPVLLPGERTSTLHSPARELYGALPAIDARPGIWDASLMVGYVWADEPRATAAAVMTGDDMEALGAAAEALAQDYWTAREAFVFCAWTGSIARCIDRALASSRHPFVIADSGDNPTGGGVGDRPDVLRELLARGVSNTILAGIADAPATDMAYAAGLGRTIRTRVGAALDPAGGPPVEIDGVVACLTDAQSAADRQAVVEVGGLSIVLTARRRPFHRIEDLTMLGLNPAAAYIVVVKSGYLVPEIEALASGDAMALSAGVVDQAVERLPRLRKAEPTFPFDRDFLWRPHARPSARARRQRRGPTTKGLDRTV